jgi:glycerophosphoryl diester phosphodiesterase
VSKILLNLPSIHQQLIGHRGAAGLAPENTISSFIQASRLKLNWVEFDTRMCATGEWVVIHDETLDRTTNGTGLVAETPYEFIKTLEAGSWFNPQFKNQRVPLLSETLNCLVELNIHPNIEIKPLHCEKNNKILKIQSFLAQLESSWPKTLPPPLVSSFDWEILLIIQSCTKKIPLGYVVKEASTQIIDTVLKHEFNTLHCDHKTLLATVLHYAKACRLPLLVYTVNEAQQVQKLLDAGALAVFSDLTSYGHQSTIIH